MSYFSILEKYFLTVHSIFKLKVKQTSSKFRQKRKLFAAAFEGLSSFFFIKLFSKGTKTNDNLDRFCILEGNEALRCEFVKTRVMAAYGGLPS